MTAIRLDYSGAKVIKKECSDLTGGGGCSYIIGDDYDPLTVRCTAGGCTLHIIDRLARPIDGPLMTSGDVADPDSDCAPSHWTIKLTPVGEVTTEGITHPARLVGTLTASRPAKILPKFNCLGADEIYRYDATPS